MTEQVGYRHDISSFNPGNRTTGEQKGLSLIRKTLLGTGSGRLRPGGAGSLKSNG